MSENLGSLRHFNFRTTAVNDESLFLLFFFISFYREINALIVLQPFKIIMSWAKEVPQLSTSRNLLPHLYTAQIWLELVAFLKNCCNYPNIRTVRFYHTSMHPKDADRMANSVNPDQTAPFEWSDLGLHCLPDLFVHSLGSLMKSKVGTLNCSACTQATSFKFSPQTRVFHFYLIIAAFPFLSLLSLLPFLLLLVFFLLSFLVLFSFLSILLQQNREVDFVKGYFTDGRNFLGHNIHFLSNILLLQRTVTCRDINTLK